MFVMERKGGKERRKEGGRKGGREAPGNKRVKGEGREGNLKRQRRKQKKREENKKRREGRRKRRRKISP